MHLQTVVVPRDHLQNDRKPGANQQRKLFGGSFGGPREMATSKKGTNAPAMSTHPPSNGIRSMQSRVSRIESLDGLGIKR